MEVTQDQAEPKHLAEPEEPEVWTEAAEVSTEPAEPTSEAWHRRHRVALRGVACSLVIFAVSRVLTTLAVHAGTVFIPGKDLRTSFLSWDAAWYYKAILGGYPREAITGTGVDAQNTIAFFPLYPMTARTIDDVTFLSTFESMVALALLSGAAATVLLWFLAKRISNERTANVTVALFCFFPGSAAMLLPYPEGLMVAFSVACLLMLMDRHWLLAGIFAALATASRPNALVLVGCCAWAAMVAIHQRREWRSLVAPLLAPLGIVGYFTFLWHHTGSFMAWFEVEKVGWAYDQLDRLIAFKALPFLWEQPFGDVNMSSTALSLVIAAIGLVFLAKMRPPMTLVIFALGSCFLCFFSGGSGSKLRYMATMFPLIIATAYWAAKSDWRVISLVAAGATGLTIYSIIATQTMLSIF